MFEWIKNAVPHYDSTVGALIGAVAGIALYLVGRWALRRDRVTIAEEVRWKSVQSQLNTHELQLARHEILLGQTVTRAEIMDALNESVIRSGDNIKEVIDGISGRLDRMDSRADRMEERRKLRDKELIDAIKMLFTRTENNRGRDGTKPHIHPYITDDSSS